MDATVFIVDDDASIRDALSLLLSLRGLRAQLFASAEDFLSVYQPEWRGCLLTDLRMPGLSGIELIDALRDRHVSLPIILLTAHGDVATTRTALRGGAFDFLEKPIDEDILLEVLRNAIGEDARNQSRMLQLSQQRARLDRLTPRERDVLERLGRGLQNREIAVELNISPRTVEVYKARMMEKLECSNLADVVRVSLLLGLPQDSDTGP
jgi:FixJ family two-component response regulator